MTRVLRPTAPRRIGAPKGGYLNGHARTRPEPTHPLFTLEDGWSVLHAAAPADADPLGGVKEPGLWRYVGGTAGKPVERVFELPPLPDVEDDGESSADDLLAECRAWALDGVPVGWQPPERDEVESWLPPGGLAIRAGAHARQAALVHEPGRLALTCPILTNIPAGLSAARRGWLRAVLLDGQNRWRLVRVCLTDSAALAEIDFSGAPPAIVESLFRTGLGALRWVVAWLVESAAFLADPSVTCRAVEVCPSAGPARRKE